MEQTRLSRRATLIVIVVGLVCAVLAAGSAYFVVSSSGSRYRAETQVALLPARNTPPEDLSNYWEALSRGQAARIGAEVLGQRRWLAPAAQSAGVPVESIVLSAGAVADTTLIDISLEGPSAAAAETALTRVVIEATPVVEDVSGPFALEVVQSAAGSAEKLGAAVNQLLAVVGAAGLLIGSGVALLVVRRRERRQAPDSASGPAGPVAVSELAPAEPVPAGDSGRPAPEEAWTKAIAQVRGGSGTGGAGGGTPISAGANRGVGNRGAGNLGPGNRGPGNRGAGSGQRGATEYPSPTAPQVPAGSALAATGRATSQTHQLGAAGRPVPAGQPGLNGRQPSPRRRDQPGFPQE